MGGARVEKKRGVGGARVQKREEEGRRKKRIGRRIKTEELKGSERRRKK